MRLISPPAPQAYTDGEGRRLLLPEVLTDDDIAHLALDELRLAAAGNPTVCTYLFEMIAEVTAAVDSDPASVGRAETLVDQAALLLDDTRHGQLTRHDRAAVHDAYVTRLVEPPDRVGR